MERDAGGCVCVCLCVALISSLSHSLSVDCKELGGRVGGRMERGDGGVWQERNREAEGWKVKLQSEKGRQLVTCVCL